MPHGQSRSHRKNKNRGIFFNLLEIGEYAIRSNGLRRMDAHRSTQGAPLSRYLDGVLCKKILLLNIRLIYHHLL